MSDSLKSTKQLLETRKYEFKSAARHWKLLYRSLLVISTVFSAGAAVMVNLEPSALPINTTLWASVFAALAAVSTTAIASLECEKNWSVNRRAKHQTDLLLLEIEKGEQSSNYYIDGLKAIVEEQLNKTTED